MEPDVMPVYIVGQALPPADASLAGESACPTSPRLNHLDDLRADGQRCRGGRTRRVEHVQRVGARDQAEVLHQLALGRDGLRAHAAAAGYQIGGLDLGHQALERAAEDVSYTHLKLQ